MAAVEPVPGEAAATAEIDGERALVIADYHAGIEWALAVERGVEVESRAERRRERLTDLVERTQPDRLVVLGDLMHSIGEPGGSEREEVEDLVDALDDLPITLVKGNHDGAIEDWVPRVEVTDGTGVATGDYGFAHGHTWPDADVLGADVVCVGHEHPQVRLEDEVGGHRVERVWLRGPMDMAPFAERDPELPWLEGDLPPADVDLAPTDVAATDGEIDSGGGPAAEGDGVAADASGTAADTNVAAADADDVWTDPELVVFPSFNDLAGGTWINVEGQEFLAPFLPDALETGEAFLLDGTRLGDYRAV